MNLLQQPGDRGRFSRRRITHRRVVEVGLGRHVLHIVDPRLVLGQLESDGRRQCAHGARYRLPTGNQHQFCDTYRGKTRITYNADKIYGNNMLLIPTTKNTCCIL